jgi:hypothetical protein
MVLLRTRTLGVFVLPLACSAAPQTAARAPAAAPHDAAGPAPAASANSATTTAAAADTPVQNFAHAEALAQNELGAEGRDARFAADRQVAELERAMLLYKEFIRRAGDDPAYAEAVKRAKDRIDDLNDTLIFIRKNPND